MNSEIDSIIQIIKENIDPEKIILFGSKINDPDNESDFDLFILKKDVKHRRKLAQYIYKLLYSTKLAYDILVDTPEHYQKLKSEPSYVYAEIEKTGKVLYEKN